MMVFRIGRCRGEFYPQIPGLPGRLHPSASSFLLESYPHHHAKTEKPGKVVGPAWFFCFSACRKSCPLLKSLCSCVTQRGSVPRPRLLLLCPKPSCVALAAADFDRGINPCSLLSSMRDTSGALPLDPASSCCAQNCPAPLLRRSVLTAAPIPARCFPHCGICRGLCPSTPSPLAVSKTGVCRIRGCRF